MRAKSSVSAGVEQGDVGGDESLILQPLHPSVTGRGRQVDQNGKFGIGNAALLLPNRQDAAIGCVKFPVRTGLNGGNMLIDGNLANSDKRHFHQWESLPTGAPRQPSEIQIGPGVGTHHWQWCSMA